MALGADPQTEELSRLLGLVFSDQESDGKQEPTPVLAQTLSW